MEKLPILEQQEKLKSQIEVRRNERDEIEDLIVIEGEKRFGLREYLPIGISFNDKDPIFAFSPDLKYVKFSEQLMSINSREGRLALLHEMGHALDFNKHPEIWKDSKEHELWLHKIKKISVKIKLSKEYDRLSESERHDFLEKKIKDLHAPKEIEALANFLAILERNAWAEALKLYRRIRKEKGVDIFLGTSNKDITSWVEEQLSSYDRVFRNFMTDPQLKLFLINKFSGALEQFQKKVHLE